MSYRSQDLKQQFGSAQSVNVGGARFARSGKFAALLGSVGLMGVLGTNFAVAETIADTQQVVVHYEGLDLNSESGAAILYTRLRAAARQVCAPLDSRDPARHAHFVKCVNTALAQAVADVNVSLVSALHRTERRIAKS